MPGGKLFDASSSSASTALRGRQRVRAGQLEDADADRGVAGEIGVDGVVLRAQLDPRDVAQPGQPSLIVGLENDVAEFLRRRQPALGLDAELERRAAAVERRLADRAGRDLRILRRGSRRRPRRP